MNIAFTGSRVDPTSAQCRALRMWLRARLSAISQAHHGACVGSDAYFALALHEMGAQFPVHAHPGHIPHLTDQPSLLTATHVHPAKDTLQRNLDIIADATILLACPDGPERTRSGTWSTVRAASNRGIPVVVITPEG